MTNERMMSTEQFKESNLIDSLVELLMGWNAPPAKIHTDEDTMGEYNGTRYMVRHIGSWYCAYIEVPMDLDTPNFVCPWGVTWGDYADDEKVRVKWPNDEPAKDDMKIIGWDYNHTATDSHHYTRQEVMDDVMACIDSLKEA